MLLFHTPMISTYLCLFFHCCSYKKIQYRWHSYWGIGKATGKLSEIGIDRDRYSEIEYITIPYSNSSQSAKYTWFVLSSNRVPTKNAKSLTPLLGGWLRTATLRQDKKIDRNNCSEIEYITVPYSNYSQSIKHDCLVSSCIDVPHWYPS